MLRGVLSRLVARLRSDEATDDEESGDTRFVPSLLDASVRYAHGASNTGVEREVAAIEEEARRLEEQHRDE